jgi:hypothetical protein
MKPKEKAGELVLKYYNLWINGNSIMAKQCALIAVDEIIKSTFSKKWYEKNKIIPADYLLTEYWEEVKQEIEKL